MAMSLYTKALLLAVKSHGEIDQTRSYTGEPYVLHPIRVAERLRPMLRLKAPFNVEEAMAAALLHDVLEDTKTTEAEMRLAVGDAVTELVKHVTDSEPGNRAARQAAARDRLSKAPMAAQLMKLGDVLDNVVSIVEHDRNFAKKMLPEKWALLKVMRPKFDPLRLWQQAVDAVVRGAEGLGVVLD